MKIKKFKLLLHKNKKKRVKQNLRKLIKDIFLDLIYMKSKGKRERGKVRSKRCREKRGKGSVVKNAKKKTRKTNKKVLKYCKKSKKVKNRKMLGRESATSGAKCEAKSVGKCRRFLFPRRARARALVANSNLANQKKQ